MAFGKPPRPSSRRSAGPPAWLTLLIGIALVFGVYYVWLGVQNFLRSGGLGVQEVTQRAVIIGTATAERLRPTSAPALVPTFTPPPTCEAFVVSVPNARVREAPSDRAAVVTSFFANQEVCVVGRPNPDSEWYTIDTNPRTRRIEAAYMHETVIRAVNPTLTPTRTPTLTRTPTETPTPTQTPTPQPGAAEAGTTPAGSATPMPTPTPLPTITPTPTLPSQSA